MIGSVVLLLLMWWNTLRVLSRSLELAQMVEGTGQSAVGTYQERRVGLLLRESINALGDLHRGGQLVGQEAMAPLTGQCGIQQQGTIQRMAQGLGTPVANARLNGTEPSRGRQVRARLHKDEKLIFIREALTFNVRLGG